MVRARARVLRGAIACAQLWAAAACSGGPVREPEEVDCGALDDYDFITMQPLEGTMNTWFAFGDDTPGAVRTFELRPIPEGRCGSTAALVLTVRGHQDWGAGFGEYQMPMAPVDARDYEGVSFWAMAAGYGTSTGFLFTVNDRNTNMMGNVCTEPMADVAASGYTVNEAGMQVPVGGDLPGPNDCGNGFQRVVVAERQWHLHLLPFESFQQTANPNRVPTGIDRSGLYQFSINMPKDSNLELWIDDIGVYRRRETASPDSVGKAPD